jgi:hypothetical protein
MACSSFAPAGEQVANSASCSGRCCAAEEMVDALVQPSGRGAERSELKRAFCSSLSEW